MTVPALSALLHAHRQHTDRCHAVEIDRFIYAHTAAWAGGWGQTYA